MFWILSNFIAQELPDQRRVTQQQQQIVEKQSLTGHKHMSLTGSFRFYDDMMKVCPISYGDIMFQLLIPVKF